MLELVIASVRSSFNSRQQLPGAFICVNTIQVCNGETRALVGRGGRRWGSIGVGSGGKWCEGIEKTVGKDEKR